MSRPLSGNRYGKRCRMRSALTSSPPLHATTSRCQTRRLGADHLCVVCVCPNMPKQHHRHDEMMG